MIRHELLIHRFVAEKLLLVQALMDLFVWDSLCSFVDLLPGLCLCACKFASSYMFSMRCCILV
jgi:hypothetical protein